MFTHKTRTDDIIRPSAEVAKADVEPSLVAEAASPLPAKPRQYRERADRILSLFLRLWLMLSVFAIPLIVVSFAYSAQGLQQLALTVLAALGLLTFLLRALAVRQEFVWRRSPLNAGLAVAAGAVVLVAFFSGRWAQIWGLAGFIPQVSPWGWLAAALLAALLVQEIGGRQDVVSSPALCGARDPLYAEPATGTAMYKGSLTTLRLATGGSGQQGLSPRSLLSAYCLSSTLLVLFVLGWYGSRNQFLIPWGIAAQAAALWLAVNAAVIFMLGSFSGRSGRWFWFAAGLAHAALLFFFDYDLIWYLLGASLLGFALMQFSFRKRSAAVSFIIPQLGLLLAVVLLLTPSSWLFGGGQPQFWSGNLINTNISWQRFRQYVWPDKKAAVFGAGEGMGALAFWQKAELVDMRQTINYPLLGNGYLNLLWDGGLALAAAFLVLIGSLIVAAVKFVPGAKTVIPNSSSVIPSPVPMSIGTGEESPLNHGRDTSPALRPAFRERRGLRDDKDMFLIAAIGIIASLVSFYFLPVTFIHLFAVFFLAAVLAGASNPHPSFATLRPPAGGLRVATEGLRPALSPEGRRDNSVFTWPIGESEERRFAAALAVVVPVILVAYLGFVWTRQFQSRLAFLRTITVSPQGQPTVNVDKLQRAVDYSPAAFGYRLSRNDIALQLLSQQNKPKFEDVQGLFIGLRADTQYLITRNLTGPERWQAAWQAELAAANLEFKEFADKEKGSLNSPAKEWYQASGALYEQAITLMPRNVILLSEAARFYRQHGAFLAQATVPAQKFYDRAQELLAKALSIDQNYEGSYLEKVELAAITKSPAEAVAEIAGFVERSPNLAFRAGQLAYAAKNYELAAKYYRQAVNQNENHLAARYELTRTYAALGEAEKGRLELSALESRLPKDNEQVNALLKELRALFSAAPAGTTPAETKNKEAKN